MRPFHMDLFNEGKFCVGFKDQKSYRKFIEMCDGMGKTWSSGKPMALVDAWSEYDKNTHLYHERSGRFMYGDGSSSGSEYPLYIFSYEEFIKRVEPDPETKLAFEFANM